MESTRTALAFAAGLNNAIASLAADGSGNLPVFAAVSGSGSVDLILDVNGYFE